MFDFETPKAMLRSASASRPRAWVRTPKPWTAEGAAEAATMGSSIDAFSERTSSSNGYGLKVNVASEPSASVKLPKAVAGVPCRVEVTGVVKKRLGK